MVSGGWGADAGPSAPGQPLRLQAIVPAESAELFGVGVGDSLSTVPYWNDAIPYATVTIAGIFERTGPDEFWHLNDAVLSASTSGNFRTVPFFLTRESYFGSLGASFTDMDSTYAWLLQVDQSKLDARNAWIARSNPRDDEEPPRAQPLQLPPDNGARGRAGRIRQAALLQQASHVRRPRAHLGGHPLLRCHHLVLVVEQQRGEIALLRSRGKLPSDPGGVRARGLDNLPARRGGRATDRGPRDKRARLQSGVLRPQWRRQARRSDIRSRVRHGRACGLLSFAALLIRPSRRPGSA